MTADKKTSALVCFSAGQDSTALLGWSLNNFDYVEAISFYYGQQHSIELEQGAKICEKLGVKRTLIDISFLKEICDSALTTTGGDVGVAHSRLKDLPASFVPNRNLILLSLANTYAQKVGITNLITGTCETDSSGYPDCRRLFIDNLESTLFSACNKLTLSVEAIREILTQDTTLYNYSAEEPTILIRGRSELYDLNSFFGNTGQVADEVVADAEEHLPQDPNATSHYLLFKGHLDCNYVLNLLLGSNSEQKLQERDDYSSFKQKLLISQAGSYDVSADESNFFIRIHTPLMYLNKAETFQMAENEGILETVLEDSHTCYLGDRTTRHPWGYGCTHLDEQNHLKECPACMLRRKGYIEYLQNKGQELDYTPPKQ